MINSNIKITLIALLAAGLALNAGAATAPDFMVTWKAADYAPASYRGKVLPSDGTRVDVALELINNNRFANLSGTNITWSLNNSLYKSGVGLKNISFNAAASKGNQVLDISFTYAGKTLAKRIVIPVVRPEVVIAGGPDIFQALLYFFNLSSPTTQAKFTWEVNGITAEGTGQNPDVLALSGDMPAGSNIGVRVDVQNLLKNFEIAGASINFTK